MNSTNSITEGNSSIVNRELSQKMNVPDANKNAEDKKQDSFHGFNFLPNNKQIDAKDKYTQIQMGIEDINTKESKPQSADLEMMKLTINQLQQEIRTMKNRFNAKEIEFEETIESLHRTDTGLQEKIYALYKDLSFKIEKLQQKI